MKTKKEENRNTKGRVVVILPLLLLLVVGTSVAYAALTQTLTARGSTRVTKPEWKIEFANATTTAGSIACTPTINADKTAVTYNPTLTNPGDYCEFTVDVVNNGTIPAKLSADPVLSSVDTATHPYLIYTATYNDGSAIRANDALAVNATKTVKIRVEFKKDITAEQLPSTSDSLDLSFSMNYIQS